MHRKRSYWAYLYRDLKNHPTHDEREWHFGFACFNSRFIVCKILYIIYLFTFNVINNTHFEL